MVPKIEFRVTGVEAAFLVAVIAIMYLAASALYFENRPSDADIANDGHLNYCEMVALHKEDPTIGWPDYKRIYDKECDK